ncbi:MAG: hypothetical protein ACHBN1_24775 [Heteroscytonema crispum UTEX LB 1556]
MFIVHCSWILGYEPLTINHQPSTINHQPSTINHQPLTVFRQPQSVFTQKFKTLFDLSKFWITIYSHYVINV